MDAVRGCYFGWPTKGILENHGKIRRASSRMLRLMKKRVLAARKRK
jgi:hypothetical protein